MENSMSRAWWTDSEYRMMRMVGGRRTKDKTFDGVRQGVPYEVKSLKDKRQERFRIGKKAHQKLLNKNGSYIFNIPGKQRKVMKARQVSGILVKKQRRWYKDRSYPHSFVMADEIF